MACFFCLYDNYTLSFQVPSNIPVHYPRSFFQLHKLSCKIYFQILMLLRRGQSCKLRENMDGNIDMLKEFYDTVNTFNGHKKSTSQRKWPKMCAVAGKSWLPSPPTLPSITARGLLVLITCNFCLSSCQSLPLCLLTNTWSMNPRPPIVHLVLAPPPPAGRVSCPLTLAKPSWASSLIVRQDVAKLLSLKLKMLAADV